MSQLKLYAPEGVPETSRPRLFDPESPTIRFEDFVKANPPRPSQFRFLDPAARAKLLFANNRCPQCSHPGVTPIELDDGMTGRGNLPIPGTATIVGFHCLGCHYEWPA